MIKFLESTQVQSFLREENFILAYKRLQTAGRCLYKDLYKQDMKIFGSNLELNVKCLVNDLRNGLYAPSQSLRYYAPKKSGMVRPMTVMNFLDLLVYQALVNIIAEKTVGEFKPYYNKIVYGNILNEIDEKSSKFFYKQWKKQWKK